MGEKHLPNEFGLSTKEALIRLEHDIEQVLNQFQQWQKSRKSKSWLIDVLHPCSQHSIINWISILVITTTILIIVISTIIYLDFWLLLQALFLIILLPLNVLISLRDSKLRHNELTRRVGILLDLIKKEKDRIFWSSENYPSLLSPFSPCITLQWTYRDNNLVNLPWALLVKDDIVVIRPGQISPGFCESLEKSSEYSLLHAKEVYGPSLQNANECFSNPKSRKPLENKKYKLLETPYLTNLRIALEQSLDRPITIQEQQRHFMTVKVMEWICLPVVFTLILIVNIVRFKYLRLSFGDYDWFQVFVLNSMAVILPLLPLIFPVVWTFLNYLGMARFICISNIKLQSSLSNPDSYDIEDSVSIDKNSIVPYSFRDVWKNFVSVLKGKETMMTRSTKIVHVLGSLTALCCVDKKGILSWPNPTAEKIFILRNVENVSQNSSLANLGELSTDADSTRGMNESIPNKSEGNLTTVAEVLDLTHNPSDPFKLQFDDTDWKKYLNSLKPLGLSILLNTCNLSTQEDYTKFCSHITCEAMYNENLVPVTNRRCLCELAKEIGFVNEAKQMFALEQQLSTFRHLQTEMARRDKYVRSLQMSTKLKFPFPHMFSVVVKELNTNSMQLLSQGTADIILDSCIDYWDGHDLCPLSYSERKKIQDFYQRSSLTAYCTAFAYRPLYKGISEKLSKMYLELPSDSRHLYLNHRSPTPIHSDCRSVLEPHIKGLVNQFYSTDSLLFNEGPLSDVSDVESCFETQCNQVFIGMVTMQYQAQMDMVHLIEQLEGACIRFVHFSKENELRSRVFSEKMGLESGWNCHISLLSERNRRESGPSECWANNGTARVSSPADLPRRVGKPNSSVSEAQPNLNENSTLDSSRGLSYSAPSAINLDTAVVKFDTERELLSNENTDHLDPTASHESINLQTEMNGASHDWQSLSCLTDSTEQSAPINFDMSNRAKLPRGIDKIRPHIEHIDNVPLLVSLFTDCTASSTKEMIHIMQDYGEVICVIGSSANYETMGVFMQADASIAIEPLYPQMCQKSEIHKSVTSDCIAPIDLSRALNSVACCLSFKREDPFSVFQLIIESRHYMSLVWNTVQFWLCSCISLTFVQILAIFLMLPFILTIGQVLWFCCIIIPLLSVSMMGTAIDVEEIKKPQGKKHIGFNFEIFAFILWCYGGKFIPMILSVILTFAGVMASQCMDICAAQNCTCALYYIPTSNSITSTDLQYFSENVLSAQNLCVILILLHLVTISVNFVHRDYSICSRSPHKNLLWICSVATVSFLQLVFSLINFNINTRLYEDNAGFQMKNFVYIFAFLSPLITFALNEFIKREEIKTNLRYQRRARLDFETKLGMNSPF